MYDHSSFRNIFSFFRRLHNRVVGSPAPAQVGGAILALGIVLLLGISSGGVTASRAFNEAETAVAAAAANHFVFLPLIQQKGNAYYVSPTGSDSNPGTLQKPWRTIGKANQRLEPGDTLYLRAGTYEDVIRPTRSGEADNPIIYTNFKNEEVTVSGKKNTAYLAMIGNKSHIIIDGLTFSYGHNSSNKRFGWLVVSGENASHNVIRNCTIERSGDPLQLYKNGYREWGVVVDEAHYTLLENNVIRGLNQGIHLKTSARFTVIRGNTVSYTSQSSIHIGSSYGVMQGTLIENNVLEHSAIEDGIQFTQNFDASNQKTDISNLGTIIRNNIIRYNSENAIDLKGAAHVVIEGNIIYGTVGSNNGNLSGWNRDSHGTIIRGNNTSTRDVIIRKNVLYDNASGIRLYEGYKVYNNTLIANNRDYTGSNSSWVDTYNPAFWSVHHHDPVIIGVGVLNNLSINHNDAEIVMRLNQDSADITVNHNGYGHENADLHAPTGFTTMGLPQWQSAMRSASGFSGNDASSIVFSDVRFMNAPAKPTGNHTQFDFRLRPDSPAIDRGGALTMTANGGSGTQIRVADAGFFHDGFGVTAGDWIQVGDDAPVQILSINYDQNTLTIGRSISWESGEGVSLPYHGSAPDIGAYEFVP